MNFQDLTRLFLAKVIRDDRFVEDFKTWPLMINDWANSKEKQLLKAFLSDCETNSVQYAQWRLLKSPEMDRFSEYLTHDPGNPDILKQQFKNLLQQTRAEGLANQILRTPEKAVELWRAFEVGMPFEDELADISQNVFKVFDEYRNKVFNKELAVEIPEWPMLSDFIGGFNPGRLALCLAQTGFGKTNLALNLALDARKKVNVWYFNMEMLIEDILERCWAIFYQARFSELRRSANIDIQKFYNSFVHAKKFRITSGRDKSLTEIQSIARAQSLNEKPGIIVIDYDQKIQFSHDSKIPEWKALQLAMISLEDLAKELGCFVLVLAQANQEGEISGSNRSRFSASSVWSFEDDEDHGAVIRFNKNRFGELNKLIKVKYDRACSKISEDELIAVVKKQKVRARV